MVDMAIEEFWRIVTEGYIGLVQEFFVSSCMPREVTSLVFYSRQWIVEHFCIGRKSPLGSIAPGTNFRVDARLYAGPQTQKSLEATAPGLEYTVDYGWLTVIAAPLFWILSSTQKLVHNWGVAIIILTILIKLAFRSEERRGGKECVSTLRTRGCPES